VEHQLFWDEIPIQLEGFVGESRNRDENDSRLEKNPDRSITPDRNPRRP
jgi:hypothetical protein